MIPLRLRLTNFLSYGEDAPVLDLEGIHVACLSGGNGQGKSALLDAMTWAVWGEARKSSEARKPDAELLRVGARAMEVDFAFRASGVDYRVVRSYTETASGKSSKPGLELQIRDADDWQPLTAESVRATQAAIDERIGIDYETFINSTFLLQGRSDEFTKKKPGERKEILGKILALDRYDRMAARAGQRWTRLRERAKTLEDERDRLDRVLEPVPEWEAERAAAAQAVDQATEALAAATRQEAGAASALAALDAARREADALERALADLAARAARLAQEGEALARRAAEAQALVDQADQIEADHERYEALRTQRADLDDKAGLFRGVDGQRHALRLEMQQKTADATARIVALEGALGTLDHQIQADEQAVAGSDQAQASLAAAEAAQSDLARLDAARAQRDRVQGRVDALDKQLAADKGALEGSRARVVEEGKRLAAEVKAAESVDVAALEQTVAVGTAAAERREALQEEGSEQAAAVTTLEARLESIDKDRARVEARRHKLDTSDDDTCPTCGSDLSPAHRDEVLAEYAAELDALATAADRARAGRQSAAERRDALRAEYVRLGAAIEAGAQAASRLQTAREGQKRQAEAAERLDVLRAEARQIQHQLAAETFSQEVRAEKLELETALAADAYDGQAHERARAAAALREHWVGQVRALAVAAERLGQSRTDRARRASDLDARRAALDRGDHLVDLQARLAALDQQVASLGYDPADHERVVKALDALAGAPRRLSALLDGRRQLAELAERRARLADDRRAIETDRAARQSSLDALQGQLAERAAAEAARVAAVARRESCAAVLAGAQGQLGALTERLARAERDRQRRAEVGRELKAVVKDRALYGHLRRAFGKNGIPSLIIEETLPEIEERANRLLERLSRGQTRVTLETLKDKKTGGGTKETLDIQITDDQGAARAYETFSGGEAFRVNFALRIALSQMLAERAGTQIRTLVIDEGFGTQDAEGLQALIGAIRAIQDDFETILVITHLDEIKDAFPIRIEVRKEPVTGSTFDVIGV